MNNQHNHNSYRVLDPYFPAQLTDKWTAHSYLPVYSRIIDTLIKRKGSKKVRILEIGVQRGGSVLGWLNAYPECEVLGVDIDDFPDFLKRPVDRFSGIRGDAYSKDMLNFLKTLPPFDFILDDGSHQRNHIAYVAENYPQFLSPTGILAIEDVPNPEWVAGFKVPDDFKVSTIDLRSVKNRADDFIIIIQK